jgi:hypothetical protein
MSVPPESLTDSMTERAQSALDFYPSESIPMSDIRSLRYLVLRHELEINPPIDTKASHNIRAVSLTEWFPDVARLLDHDVEAEDVKKPKRSFFKKKNKDSQETT